MEKLLIVSGPSGVGKGTLLSEILKRLPFVKMAVSATTRLPRSGEVHGENYYFLTPEDFESKIRENAFLEYCDVHGQKYGTLKSEVLRLQSTGHVVILEIDTQGAQKVRLSGISHVSVFIAPPTLDVLFQRLNQRDTESKEVIAERLAVAQLELQDAKNYDYVIVNDLLSDAVDELDSLIRSDNQPLGQG